MPAISWKRAACLLSLAFIGAWAAAQAPAEVPLLPVRFGQFAQGYSAINPASVGSQRFFRGSVGHQRQGSNWTQVYTTYATAEMRITDAQEDGFHAGGLAFWSDHEGQLLSRTAFYAQYAYHQRLLENMRLSVGLALGGMSYLVQGTDINPSGGDTSPDGALGLWVYGDGYFSGFSINHLFNSRLQPVEQRFRLATHYNFTAGKTFLLTPDLDLTFMTQSRFSSVRNVETDLAMRGVVSRKLVFGTNYRVNQSVVFMAGVEGFQVGWGEARCTFSYEAPTADSASPFGIYELTAVYLLDAW